MPLDRILPVRDIAQKVPANWEWMLRHPLWFSRPSAHRQWMEGDEMPIGMFTRASARSVLLKRAGNAQSPTSDEAASGLTATEALQPASGHPYVLSSLLAVSAISLP